jgi:hypothetical protein
MTRLAYHPRSWGLSGGRQCCCWWLALCSGAALQSLLMTNADATLWTLTEGAEPGERESRARCQASAWNSVRLERRHALTGRRGEREDRGGLGGRSAELGDVVRARMGSRAAPSDGLKLDFRSIQDVNAEA